MAILTKNNILFLHIPKTGTNWTIEILKINNLIKEKLVGKHDTLKLLNKRYNKINYLKKVCFVRNPISWYESAFKYYTSINWRVWNRPRWHPCRELWELGDKSFNKFIENVIKNCPSYLSKMYELYTKDCDFIGRQENLKDDLIEVLGIKELKLIGKVNVSNRIDIQWDVCLKNRIIELEKDVFIKYYE